MTDEARMAYSEGFNSPGDVSNGARHDRGVAAVVAWARANDASVVPITRLREWIENEVEADSAYGGPQQRSAISVLGALSRLLDDVECASNPNNERTNP